MLAIVVYLSTALQDGLIYDRAAISSGQIWRVITGHFVHFTPIHLMANLVVLVTAGVLVEQKNLRFYPLLLISAMITIGTGLFLADPALRYYGGLSGIALAVLVYLCLWGLHEPGAWRWFCTVVLVAIALKTTVELTTGHSFFFDAASAGFKTVPLSHTLGILTGLLVYTVARWLARANA